jgi:hypothetical protein
MTTFNTTRIRNSLIAAGGVLAALLASTQLTPAEENEVHAVPVERTESGEYACSVIDTGSDCGDANWILSLQADGSRILRSYSYVTANGTQNSSVMRAGKNFRTEEGFMSLHRYGEFFRSTFLIIEGSKLFLTVNGPDGHYTKELDVPEDINLLMFPVNAYGWLTANYDHDKGGPQPINLCAVATIDDMPACGVTVRDVEFLGKETITVPAGTFETDHYKIGSSGDTWITGPDLMVVQHQHSRRNLRFELIEYQSSP